MAKGKLSVVEQVRAAEADEANTGDAVVDAIFNQPTESAAFELFADIPVPDTTRTRASKYPWDTMGVGASFFVPNAKLDSFSTLVSTRNKKGPGKYIVRKWTGKDGVLGVMVWRKS